jgi:hypothetical protein
MEVLKMKKAVLFLLVFLFICFAIFGQGSGDSSSSGYVRFILIVVIAIVIFIICRELVCWYYKTNKLVKMIEEQNTLLVRLLEHFEISTKLPVDSSFASDYDNSEITENDNEVNNERDKEKDKDKIVI